MIKKFMLVMILILMLPSISCEGEKNNDSCNCVAVKTDLLKSNLNEKFTVDPPLGVDDLEGIPYGEDCSNNGRIVTIDGKEMKVFCEEK